MSDIFISYATADREAAHRLADRLGELGLSVWWDRNIPPGQQFDEVIQDALNAAKCVIVLWSAQSVRSSWVKTEATEALTMNKLVPALIDVVVPPMEFKRIQAADLSRWSGDTADPQYRSLVASVRRMLQGESKHEGADGLEPQSREIRPPMQKTRGSRVVQLRALRHPAAWAAVIIVAGLSSYAIFSGLTGGSAGTSQDDSPIASTADSTRSSSTRPTDTGGSSADTTAPTVQGKRTNLLASDAGGEIVVASSEDWLRTIDGNHNTSFIAYDASTEAVFAFRDGRHATFDTFAVLIPASASKNLNEFELLAGNETPTGKFDSIRVFRTQNVRVMKNPFQEFRFPSVKAKYIKLRPLKSHGASYIEIFEIALFGTVN